MASQFADMKSLSNFLTMMCFCCYWSKFHVNIMTGSGLVQFLFITNQPEIWKLKMHPSEFCQISGDWEKLGMPNFQRMSVIKSC